MKNITYFIFSLVFFASSINPMDKKKITDPDFFSPLISNSQLLPIQSHFDELSSASLIVENIKIYFSRSCTNYLEYLKQPANKMICGKLIDDSCALNDATNTFVQIYQSNKAYNVDAWNLYIHDLKTHIALHNEAIDTLHEKMGHENAIRLCDKTDSPAVDFCKAWSHLEEALKN